tara:strand:+ start:374 stop:655 length:282 start_codon:yes stop_codon:yes gene_type:complete
MKSILSTAALALALSTGTAAAIAPVTDEAVREPQEKAMWTLTRVLPGAHIETSPYLMTRTGCASAIDAMVRATPVMGAHCTNVMTGEVLLQQD